MTDLLEVAMKAATFLGVLVCAVLLVAARPSPKALRRALVLGCAGVALMVVNAWLGPWGLVADVAYLGAAAWTAWRALAAAPTPARPATTFTLVASR